MNTEPTQALLRSQFDIREEALQYVAQELHDNIGQILILAKLNLVSLDTSDSSLLQEKLRDTVILLSKAIKDLRCISHGLSTDFIFDSGLAGAIEYVLDFIRKSGLFKVKFLIEGEPGKLNCNQELILFRIIQEALHNIIKHACATEITVCIKYEADFIMICITDNGHGFSSDPDNQHFQPGFSLGRKSMDQRATLVNASLRINSCPGKGTEVCLIAPYIHS